jgi:hypothetical protein
VPTEASVNAIAVVPEPEASPEMVIVLLVVR